MKQSSYFFDYASASPVRSTVMKAMEPYFSDFFHNPSADYPQAHNASKALERARQSVARSLGVKHDAIIFTGSCTEANNLAVHGVMSQYPQATVLTTDLEHDSVIEPASTYTRRSVPLAAKGAVDLGALEHMLYDDNTIVLLSCMLVNNETGSVLPLRKIARLVQDVRMSRKKTNNELPLYLHTDCAQAPLTQNILIDTLGVDLMSLSGAKIYGPKGVGALYVGPEVQLQPLITGGGQERGLRSGTQNVALIVGFAQALEDACSARREESARLKKLTEHVWDRAKQASMRVVGEDVGHDGRITSLILPGVDNERAVYVLGQKGYAISKGSACHASSTEPSRVLKALHYSDDDARSCIRVSLGFDSDAQSVDRLMSELSTLVA